MAREIDATRPLDGDVADLLKGGRRTWLTILVGTEQGKLFPLDPGTVVIGRSSSADIVIADSEISRGHVEITTGSDGNATIRDCGSTNGTLLGSSPVNETPRVLRDGAIIQVGNSILRYSFKDQVEELFERRLYDSATRDSLTGVYNKRHFTESLERAFARSVRNGMPLGLIMFDLDGFKEINDRLGHPAGDQLLMEIGSAISDTLRNGETAARWGGDEFTLLLTDATIEGTRTCAERLRQVIASVRVELTLGDVQVTASIGVASTSEEGHETAEQLLHQADRSLYRAKRAGKNRVGGPQEVESQSSTTR